MGKNPSQHSANRLTYAIDSAGKPVHVDKVPTGNKCGCFCPACKEPLMAKNQGSIRVHHFAHQSGTDCAYAFESMLHCLAKEKIRNTFLSKSEFWIDFEYKSFCSKDQTCKFLRYGKCYTSERKRFDIKQYYDSCEQEITYDNINGRSDLKFFSSTNPERSPIYLEFCVTHASSSEKLHSGNKIIEIYIESEEDIRNLAEQGIIESEDDEEYDEYNDAENDLRQVCFYGFKNEDRNNKVVSSDIEFIRYILYKSGKMRCFQDSCDCKKLSRSKPALLEICIHTLDSFEIRDQVKYFGFRKSGIPNCVLCENYVENYNGEGKICRLYKYLQIPQNKQFDTSRAKTCNRFAIDRDKMESVLEKGLSEEYTILQNN